MRFVCTEFIDKYDFIYNITKSLNTNEITYTDIGNTELEKILSHYEKSKSITNNIFINPLAKKYFTTKDVQSNKTISELATIYDITIQTNINNISTLGFNYNFNQITNMRSPFWYTIIRDDGIVYLAKPFPLATSTLHQISVDNILTVDINYMNIGFEGQTDKDYTLWKPPSENNNVEPYSSYNSVLNSLMINKSISNTCKITFTSNQEMLPLDRIQYQCEKNLVEMLIINKKIKNDLYVYTAIKQSTIIL
jgi:hypothetical protein